MTVRRMEVGAYWVELRPPVDDLALPPQQRGRWVVAAGRGHSESYVAGFDREDEARQQANRSWRAACTANRVETRTRSRA